MTDKIKVFTLLPRMSNLVALSFGQGERAAVSFRFVDKGSDHIDVIFRNLRSCNLKTRKKLFCSLALLPFLDHSESLAKGRPICPYQRGRGGLCLSPEALGEHLTTIENESRFFLYFVAEESAPVLENLAHSRWP